VVKIVTTLRETCGRSHGILANGAQLSCGGRDSQLHGPRDLGGRRDNRNWLVERAQEILCQINRKVSARECSPSRRWLDDRAEEVKHHQSLTTAVGNGSVPHTLWKIDDAIEELRLAVNDISKQGE